MLRIYRQSSIRDKYPSSTWVVEIELYLNIKNPLSADWWRTWVMNPHFKGQRWRGIAEGLTIFRLIR